LFAQTGATVTLDYSTENTTLPKAVTYQNEGQKSYYPSIKNTSNAEMSDEGETADWAT
jgi:hypothetical protein